MTAMASPSARKVSLLVFVLAISCALLGKNSCAWPLDGDLVFYLRT
jgi:hypothetical protein